MTGSPTPAIGIVDRVVYVISHPMIRVRLPVSVSYPSPTVVIAVYLGTQVLLWTAMVFALGTIIQRVWSLSKGGAPERAEASSV